MRRWCLLPAVLLLAGSVRAGTPPKIQFRDMTNQTGVDFRHTFGDKSFHRILKATGSGVAIFDYDNDGDFDLYFVNGKYLPGICDDAGKVNANATNHLYRNDGVDPSTGFSHFTDVTKEEGVGDTGYGMGAVVGDYDNDGYEDLYVTNYGPNVLYHNEGVDPKTGKHRGFKDVTAEAGVAGPAKLNARLKWSTNAVFFDYDRDGRLDLWVTNYMAFRPEFNQYYEPEGMPGPLNYAGQTSMLYHNVGGGKFVDVTKKAGVFNPDGHGMGAAACDFDGDGWPDIYQANDAQTNYLYRNNHDGTFTDVGLETNSVRGQGGEHSASMHPATGDYDNDGWMDLFIPDTVYFSLLRNATGSLKTFYFDDMTRAAGIAGPAGSVVGWGGFFFDYDNDGWLDIFVATGDAHLPQNQANLVYRNLGPVMSDGHRIVKFEDVSESLGKRVFYEKRLSRGAAAADLDNDGDLDVVIVNIDTNAEGKEGRPTILENVGGNRDSWLDIALHGTVSNRDGIGAKVAVTAEGRTMTAYAGTSPSYLSSVQDRLHFGLGHAKTADRVVIDWPSGTRQVLESVKARQLLTVTEPAKKGGE